MSKIKEIIVLTASYYERPISSQVLEMYARDLADLDEAEVIAAYETYRRNPKNFKMPLPAQIRQIVSPSIDEDSLAREVASRVLAAITKYGWSNPSEAKLFIGPVGWQIVNRFGGWEYLCSNVGTTIDFTTINAQMRDVAKSHLVHGTAAIEENLSIGSSTQDQILLESFKKKLPIKTF